MRIGALSACPAAKTGILPAWAFILNNHWVHSLAFPVPLGKIESVCVSMFSDFYWIYQHSVRQWACTNVPPADPPAQMSALALTAWWRSTEATLRQCLGRGFILFICSNIWLAVCLCFLTCPSVRPYGAYHFAGTYLCVLHFKACFVPNSFLQQRMRPVTPYPSLVKFHQMKIILVLSMLISALRNNISSLTLLSAAVVPIKKFLFL